MKTCCIIGHRDFEKTNELERKLKDIILCLIEREGVTTFLFGSKSKFVDFCYNIVTEYKKLVFVKKKSPPVCNIQNRWEFFCFCFLNLLITIYYDKIT